MTVSGWRRGSRIAQTIGTLPLLAVLSSATQAAGIEFHDGYMRFDTHAYEDASDQQDLRQHRYARWMKIQDSRDVRSYALNSTLGNGIDNRLDFNHSQVELYDADHWNPETLLHSTTQFQLVQKAGQSWIHAAGNFTEAESHYQTGISLGRLFVAASSGYGTGFSRLGGDQADLDPWFFHGGSAAKYDFSGTALGFSLTDSTHLGGGAWRLVSDGLETRKARFVSVDQSSGGMNFGIRVYDFSRGSESIAQSLQLVARHRLGGIGFRDFRHDNGARERELNLSYAGFSKARVGLTVSERNNPLFRATEETRVMLTLSGRLGGKPGNIFSVDENSEEEPDQESNRVRNSVLIGLGVVAGVAVASSGSDDKDDATRYPREEGAAFGVARSTNPTCVRENREYGAWIYRNQDGSYAHLPVRRGDVASVSLGSPSAVPSGSVATASYHCHGGPDPRYINEEFSPQDLRADRFFNVNGYLSTPGGALKKHTVSTDTISRIGTVPID